MQFFFVVQFFLSQFLLLKFLYTIFIQYFFTSSFSQVCSLLVTFTVNQLNIETFKSIFWFTFQESFRDNFFFTISFSTFSQLKLKHTKKERILSDHTQPKVPRYPQIMANQKSLKPPKKKELNECECEWDARECYRRKEREILFARVFFHESLLLLLLLWWPRLVNWKNKKFPHVRNFVNKIFPSCFFHIKVLIKALSLDDFPMNSHA